MATIVNNPPATQSDSSGLGFLLGVILLLAIVVLFFMYGLPAIRGAVGTPTTPQVNVPSNVNVHMSK